jgi:hypothetical protein
LSVGQAFLLSTTPLIERCAQLFAFLFAFGFEILSRTSSISLRSNFEFQQKENRHSRAPKPALLLDRKRAASSSTR